MGLDEAEKFYKENATNDFVSNYTEKLRDKMLADYAKVVMEESIKLGNEMLGNYAKKVMEETIKRIEKSNEATG